MVGCFTSENNTRFDTFVYGPTVTLGKWIFQVIWAKAPFYADFRTVKFMIIRPILTKISSDKQAYLDRDVRNTAAGPSTTYMIAIRSDFNRF